MEIDEGEEILKGKYSEIMKVINSHIWESLWIPVTQSINEHMFKHHCTTLTCQKQIT